MFKHEEIGRDSGRAYMARWILFCSSRFVVYLHHFTGDDQGSMHDHPREFWSIGLWGSYIEITPQRVNRFKAPWFRWFPPEHIHRIILPPDKSCWSIVVAGPRVREWGFWAEGRFAQQVWIPWRQYVIEHGGNPGEERTSCP